MLLLKRFFGTSFNITPQRITAMHSNFNDLKTKTMEDINNALLHIKAKHNGEIPYKYGSQECAKLMNSYAKEYYERKLKLLGLGVVSNAERTLNDFFAYLDGLGDKFDSNSLEGHKRDWLKSFNDC